MSDLRVTNLRGRTAGSVPSLPDGVVISGVTTANSVIISGITTANSSGVTVVGIITATSFSGDGSTLTGIESWNQLDTWLYGGG